MGPQGAEDGETDVRSVGEGVEDVLLFAPDSSGSV